MLIVFDKNPAKRLYEKFGFREAFKANTPGIAKVFGNDYDVVVRMERPLKLQ
jgi:hypothetical protein